ncbi:alpha/beta hydrolase [Thiosocius teredinicola]|uniref:alpha/beta hydrolase n=1 Tax=Thiosocius teredinicola TaxID=1973002 RepID=UPI000990A9F1
MSVLRWLVIPIGLLLLLAWAWIALHAPPDPHRLENGASIEWVDCWFETPWWRPVHCGRFHTAFEQGAQPQQFSLPVVYIPQWFWLRGGPPVQYIAGGPGGSAWLQPDEAPFWLEWAKSNRWNGDLVLYDQRGVGLSNPALDCPELHELRREMLPVPVSNEEAYPLIREATRACHDRLQAEGWDLRRFTTRHNADDAIDLMRTMGLEQWNVYGVSYGTRVALEMMRMAPESLRAVILDSPYPPHVNPELADAWLLQRVFELFSRICGLADQCADSPEALTQVLEAAFERVQREPVKLSVRDPLFGGDLAVVYTDDDLPWLLFEAFYQWDLIPRLPDSMRELAEGELDSNLRDLIQTSIETFLDFALSDPVATSVDCHDTAEVTAAEAERELRRFPRAAPYKKLDWEFHACRFWESGRAPADFFEPVRSAVPTLVLAGEFDPVTPPEWAESTDKYLENSELFIFPGIGHGVLDSHVCAAELSRVFLADPQNPAPPQCLSGI